MNEKNCYRDILKATYAQRAESNKLYSLRAFARDLEISPQRLSHVLNGKYGLSLKAAKKLAQKLGLDFDETNYFCALVEKNHAKSKAARLSAESRVTELKSYYKDLSMDHFKVISDWYHYAIMELTIIENISNNYALVAKKLGITETEAKFAIERLLKLELLEFNKVGNLKITGNYFADPKGIPSSALRSHHKQLIEKSLNALNTQPLDQREFLSTVLAIDPTDLDEAKNDLRKFRVDFDNKYSNGKNKNKVYCLSTQFFELTTNA